MRAVGGCRAEERLLGAILDAELSAQGFGAQGEVTAGDLRGSDFPSESLELRRSEGIDCLDSEDAPGEGRFGQRVCRVEVAIGVQGFEAVDGAYTAVEPRLIRAA